MSKRQGSYWNQSQCIGCGEPFAVMGGTAIQQLMCLECITDFGIESDDDITEVLDMFGFNQHHNQQPVVEAKKLPEKPKVDPKVVAAGVRTQVAYAVMPVSEFKKPITYICAKN